MFLLILSLNINIGVLGQVKEGGEGDQFWGSSRIW